MRKIDKGEEMNKWEKIDECQIMNKCTISNHRLNLCDWKKEKKKSRFRACVTRAKKTIFVKKCFL